MIPSSSTFTACERNKQKFRRRSLLRVGWGFIIPFLTLFVQLRIWPLVNPFYFFGFYPAVFLSAWFGGVASGLISTIISILVCWHYFIPVEEVSRVPDWKYVIPSIAFVTMGTITSFLTGYLRKTIKLRDEASLEWARKEAQWKEAQRIGKFGSWAWNIRKNYLEWSEEAYRLFGLDPERAKMTYEIFTERVHPQDREMLQRVMNETLSTGKPYSLEFRIRLPDGAEKVVYSVADAYLEEGRVTEMIGTVHDITDRKRAEEVLEESEKKFRGLLETASDPIVIVNSLGILEFVNQQVKSKLGYDSTDILGKPIEILVPDRLRSAHAGQRAEYMHHPKSRPMGRNLQLSARKRDGSDLPVDISLSPFETKRGNIVTAFIRDMSDRRRVEARERFLFDTTRILSESLNYQDRIQRIADLVVPPLADICLVHIQEGERLILRAIANQAAANAGLLHKIFSKGAPHPQASKVGTDFVTPSETGQLIEMVTDAHLLQMARGDESLLEKFKSLNIQSFISVSMYARGRNIGVISFLRCKPLRYTKEDLEFSNLVADRAALAVDNARLYHEAQIALQQREDVLAIVSHDLKNPLGVVRGLNEILTNKLRSLGANQSDIDAANAIARSARQMERLVGDLLDFSKIQSGTLAIEAKPCSVSRLILDGVESVKHHAERMSIRTQIDIQPELPDVNCDPDRITQVLSNLLGNAIKFSPENSVLKVQAKREGSSVDFIIADTGPGMPKEVIPHIFDPYWQAKETAKLGTGLGLSIAKGIVESHHGRIWVESMLGMGSTFHFSLPVG